MLNNLFPGTGCNVPPTEAGARGFVGFNPAGWLTLLAACERVPSLVLVFTLVLPGYLCFEYTGLVDRTDLEAEEL